MTQPGTRALNRILLVRLGSLGDVAHAIPVAAALRRTFPSARIDWATHPAYVPLLRLVDTLTSVIAVDTRAWRPDQPGHLLSALRAMRQVGYDAVIDLQGLLKSALLARAVGAGRTIGFTRSHLREPAARFCYTEAVDPGDAVHVVRQNLVLAGALGADIRGRVPGSVGIPVSTAAQAVTAAAGHEPFALINPGAAWPNKRWPAERFGALAEALRRTHGLMSFVLWGPDERALAETVVATSGGAARLAPPTTIPDIVALASASRLFVSGDTGPLQVAAVVGTPLVALFGPTRTERNGPWSGFDESVSRTARCECLYERRCRRARPCIEDIDVSDVLAAATRRLGGQG